jgi:hypothetical protein
MSLTHIKRIPTILLDDAAATGGGGDKKETATLDEAITKAGEVKETKETKETIEEVEETEEISAEEQQEIDDGLRLLRELKNPSTSKATLLSLARQLNVSFEEKPEKVADTLKDKVNAVVSKHLGKDYKFLSEKLALAITDAAELVAEEKNRGLADKIAQNDKNNLQNRINTATDNAFNKNYTNVDATMQRKVLEIMDDFPIKDDTDPEKYFDNLVHAAASKLGKVLVKRNSKLLDTEERIARNRNDASGRLASESHAKGSGVTGQKMTLDEAIAAALEKIK